MLKPENNMSKEYRKGEYLISTNKAKLKTHLIHSFLRESYWAKDVSFDTVKKSIKNSFCFGVFHGDKQVGFARIISDFTNHAYLCDFFIIEEYQGKGLAKWLMETILSLPKLQNIRTWMLSTKDAHKLYEKFGFTKIGYTDKLMKLSNPVG